MTELGAPPNPATPKKKGWSTWSTTAKVFAILGITIGGGMLLMFLVFMGTAVWMYLPGSQIASSVAIPPDTVAFARVHVDVDDPGVSATFTKVAAQFDAINRQHQREELPPNLRFLADLQQSQTKDMLELMWPRDLTVAVTGEEGAGVTAVLNPRRLGGLGRTILGVLASGARDRGETHEHRGHSVLDLDGLLVTHEASSFLVANSTAAMDRMLDRLDGGAGPAAPAALWSLAERLRARGDAHLVWTGLGPLLSDRGLEPSAVVHGGLVVDLVDDDTLSGTLVAQPAEGQEEAVTRAIAALLEERAADARARGMVLTSTPRPTARELVIEWSMTGVAGFVTGTITEWMTAAQRAQDEEDKPIPEGLDEETEAVEGAVEGAVDDAVDVTDEAAGEDESP